MNSNTDAPFPEKLLTYKAAAEALGIPYFKIQRAAKSGLFPVYRIYNGRRLVYLSEVCAAIRTARKAEHLL